MPSAGRPFTADLVVDLVTRGIGVAPVTLHTGVSSQEPGEPPQPERYTVPESTARAVNLAREWGRRVVAVGTTVTRALESAADPGGMVRAASGWTDLLLGPARPAVVVSGLITGWHAPGASHLDLLEAVAGAELVDRAYRAAVSAGYLWHEFGDSCLLLPAPTPAPPAVGIYPVATFRVEATPRCSQAHRADRPRPVVHRTTRRAPRHLLDPRIQGR